MECEKLRGNHRAYLFNMGAVPFESCQPPLFNYAHIQKTGDMAHFLCYNEMEGGDHALNAKAVLIRFPKVDAML